MIRRLTKDEEKLIPVYVDKWDKTSKSTEPIDKQKVAAAVALLYKCGGLEPPRDIVWCSSPIEMVGGYKEQDSLHISYKVFNINSPPRQRVRGEIGRGISIWDWDLWNDFCDKWDDILEFHSMNNLEESLKMDRMSIGNTSIMWLCQNEYMKDVFSIEGVFSPIVGIAEMAKYSGFYIPCQDICYVSERPCVIHLDEFGRIHEDWFVAIKWADGHGLYATKGVFSLNINHNGL